MDKIQITKTILHNAAGLGGAIIVGAVIRAHVPTNHIITKVCVGAGAFALGNIVGDACANEIDSTVDKFVAVFTETKTKMDDTTTTE